MPAQLAPLTRNLWATPEKTPRRTDTGSAKPSDARPRGETRAAQNLPPYSSARDRTAISAEAPTISDILGASSS